MAKIGEVEPNMQRCVSVSVYMNVARNARAHQIRICACLEVEASGERATNVQ